MNFYFTVVFLILTIFALSESHPQCLDFRPPYNPTRPLKFCERFSNYSCCNERQDKGLEYNYKYIAQTLQQKTFNKSIDKKCLDIVKDLMCLECHPYAAHVFDAERFSSKQSVFNKRRLTFPGLCRNYCLNIFEQCKDIFLQMATTDKFYKFVNSTNSTEFCSWAKISDENYCYPNAHTEKESNPKETYRNKLCVEPFTRRYFANALVAVHSNDKTHRLFVGEQRGLVYVILPNRTTLEKPFLNITDKVVNSGNPWDERGFLGLVFHPQYKTNGRFFIYYSAPKFDKGKRKNTFGKKKSKSSWNTKHITRISEMTVDPHDPYIADHSSEQPILEIDQPEPNHNGGMLLFGEDSFLYVFVGDGGGSGDRHGRYGNGQLMSTLLGKVLRINIDIEDDLFGIPQDNPFVHSNNTRPEIFAYGLRNPWRCSVDRGGVNGRNKGRIFCGDVGQNKYEEIDIIRKAKNYGWRAFEGFSCFDENICNKTDTSDLEFPILVYSHTVGRSIVGGYVYRGCDNPNLYGKYIFADTMNRRIFLATEDENNSWSSEEITMSDPNFCNNGLSSYHPRNILSFGESESGEIYILAASYPHPQRMTSLIYRIVDPIQRGDPDTCRFTPEVPEALGKIKRRDVFRWP